MPDTGWIAANSVSTENNGSNSPSWSNTSNIYSDDNSYASVSGLRSGSVQSDFLIAGFPSISIPAYATNIRAAVRVRHKKSGAQYSSARIGYLYYGFVLPGIFLICDGTVNREGYGELFADTESAEVFGGDSDSLWEYAPNSMTVSGISSGVTVKLFVYNGNDVSTTAYVDQIEVKFFYDADVSYTEVEADFVALSSVTAEVLSLSFGEAEMAVSAVLDASVYGEVSVSFSAVSALSAEPVYYDAESVSITDVSVGFLASGSMSAVATIDYIPILVWDNDDGLVSGRIQLDIDAVTLGGLSSLDLHDMLDYDIKEDLEFSVGLESDYLTGEFGFFLPSESIFTFAVREETVRAVIFKLFRNGCSGITVTRSSDSRLLFRGSLDKESVSFDHQTMMISATFVAFVDADKSIKSGSNDLDADFLQEVFGYDVSWSGDSLHASRWMKVRYAFEQMLSVYGATSVEFGNFNRLFTAFVLETTADTNNVLSPAGWQNDGAQTFSEWLAASDANVLFDRLLIYKEMLFQVGDYSTLGASTLVDVLTLLAGWMTAVCGIDATGKGYVVPTFAQDGNTVIDDDDIVSCVVKGFLPKVGNIIGIGFSFPGNLDPDPGQCFVSSREYPGGYARYDADGLHNVNLYNHLALYQVTLSGEEVMKAFFPVSPEYGSIRDDWVTGFGYSDAGLDVTHDDDLLSVYHVGSETGWNVGGSRGYYIDGDYSFCVAVSERYYEFRGQDREIYELSLARVDLEMINLYKLESGSRYGSDVLLRPILIRTNYSKGITYMEAIDVTRS